MGNNTPPLLTIIIPTLNRADTLYFTIRTVIEQQYANLRIIVSDNCSEDDIESVVNRFNDSRLSYIRTRERLTMMQHYEYVLNYSESGYLSILGSDDGFLPGSINRVAEIINKYPLIPAIGWRFGNYNWPGLPPFFMIPMANYYRLVNAQDEIKKVFKKSIYQSICFPSIYGGFVSVQLLKELRQKNGGIFFHSRIPDFFSGALIAATVREYIRLEFPITLNATSKTSAGFATINTTVDQRPFDNLLTDKGNAPFHPDLKFIRCNVVPIADALLQVNKLVPAFPKVEIKKVLDEVINELQTEADLNKFEEIKEGLIEMGKRNNLESYIQNTIQKIEPAAFSPKVISKFSIVSNTLYIDTTKTTISNVEEACHFTAQIIPKDFVELKVPFFKFCFHIKSGIRYFYLKLFSNKRRYL